MRESFGAGSKSSDRAGQISLWRRRLQSSGGESGTGGVNRFGCSTACLGLGGLSPATSSWLESAQTPQDRLCRGIASSMPGWGHRQSACVKTLRGRSAATRPAPVILHTCRPNRHACEPPASTKEPVCRGPVLGQRRPSTGLTSHAPARALRTAGATTLP